MTSWIGTWRKGYPVPLSEMEAPAPVPAAEAVGALAKAIRERDASFEIAMQLQNEVVDLRRDVAYWQAEADRQEQNAAALDTRLDELRQEKEAVEHELAWLQGRTVKEPQR